MKNKTKKTVKMQQNLATKKGSTAIILNPNHYVKTLLLLLVKRPPIQNSVDL